MAVEGHWEVTHELLALLVEEVSIMNLEPRQVRKEPITIPRPGADSDSATSEGGGPGGTSAPGLHHTPEGGMVAVGFQGMLALAAAAGAVSTVPADGDAQ